MNKKCQVFTPEDIVNALLDYMGYSNNLFGKKILENSCGDGNILVEVVNRYIRDCLEHGMNLDLIKQGLENDIYGFEIDKIHQRKCIKNLHLIAKNHQIYKVKWNILNTDFLKHDLKIGFDFVVGNPPYITYEELDVPTRSFIKENFTVCSEGKVDYCYAFIQAGWNSLTVGGKLCYIIPSNIFKNVFAQKLRDLMLPFLTNIYDYTSIKLFKNTLTSSAIILLVNGNITTELIYSDIVKGTTIGIEKENLKNKWMFLSRYNSNTNRNRRFGDYFKTSSSIATLLNEAFVIKKFTEASTYVEVQNIKIERDVLLNAVSPQSLKRNKTEFIIFPYFYSDGLLKKYNNEKFYKNFPQATTHLKKYHEKLLERDIDDKTEWYEYGRSQAIAHMNQEKLLVSTLITNKVRAYLLSSETIPYSGLYIVPKSNLPLDAAKEMLESVEFLEYVKSIGINANSDSYRITSKDIDNFYF